MRFVALLVIGLVTAAPAAAQESARFPLSPMTNRLPVALFGPDLLAGTLEPEPGVTTFVEAAPRPAIVSAAAAEPLAPVAGEAPAAEPPVEELPVPDDQPAMAEPVEELPVEEPPVEAVAVPEETPPPAPDTTTITVIVENVESGSGIVNVAVCDKGLSREGCPYVREIKAQPGFVETEFRDVPPGNYAVVGYHDVNGNNLFDKVLGMPREPYALSSKAAEKLVPTFADAALPIKAGENAVIIRLKRLGG